jgi:hypothetical protein
MRQRADRSPSTGHNSTAVLGNPHGEFAVTLIRFEGSVCVEQSQTRAGGPRFVRLMRFKEQQSFDRWCEFDRLRFTNPKLAMDVRRSGHDLFAAEP